MTPSARARAILAACEANGVQVHSGHVPPLTVETGLELLRMAESCDAAWRVFDELVRERDHARR